VPAEKLAEITAELKRAGEALRTDSKKVEAHCHSFSSALTRALQRLEGLVVQQGVRSAARADDPHAGLIQAWSELQHDPTPTCFGRDQPPNGGLGAATERLLANALGTTTVDWDGQENTFSLLQAIRYRDAAQAASMFVQHAAPSGDAILSLQRAATGETRSQGDKLPLAKTVRPDILAKAHEQVMSACNTFLEVVGVLDRQSAELNGKKGATAEETRQIEADATLAHNRFLGAISHPADLFKVRAGG
jgi:hypothetical protein